jgi:phospholipid transport system transporter-binding protein
MAFIEQRAHQWFVSGDLLMANVDVVLAESELLPIIDRLNVDFSRVNHVDTAALSLMTAWLRRGEKESCVVTFSHVSDNLKSLAGLYGVYDFLKII